MDSRDDVSAPQRAGGTVPSWEAERSARKDAEETAARLARLQAVTAALSSARTPDEVAEVTLGRGLAALGGARGLLLVPGAGGGMDVLPSRDAADALASAAARLAGHGPVRDAFHSGAPVFLPDRASVAARYPGLDGLAGEALAALPLPSQGLPLGVLLVGYDAPRAFPEPERSLAVSLAFHCAQALDRARLFVAERLARAEAVAAQRRLAFLDEVSAHLAAKIEEGEMLAGVVGLAVPALGDWAGVLAVRDEGLVLAARAGPDAVGAPVEARVRALPLERLLAIAEPARSECIEDFAEAAEGAFPRAALIAPLVVGGRALGVLAVASADPARRYGTGDRVLVADVARRAALAVAHARLLEDAQAAARAREEFLQVASHELRGPLGTLRLGVQLLLRDHHAGASKSPEPRLRMIERQADRLVRLADALLDVSRITSGRLSLAREDVDLAALVREAVARYAEEASDAGCALTCDAPGPVRSALDASRIDQVLSNLVSNALKYGHGRPVHVALTAANGVARLRVEDRGIGIDPADQARIFGRFERAVSGRHYAGLGLGLWIVHQIVAGHGGRIEVTSAPGEGSTFIVELPLSGN
ncbi:MAG TPA: GAF domain-containing sensor histidine kinase [Anaeromyxobacter sp.]|nr:GAF domain-containing sensor histidine kinase [Anaeromyxobacter sp.]